MKELDCSTAAKGFDAFAAETTPNLPAVTVSIGVSGGGISDVHSAAKIRHIRNNGPYGYFQHAPHVRSIRKIPGKI